MGSKGNGTLRPATKEILLLDAFRLLLLTRGIVELPKLADDADRTGTNGRGGVMTGCNGLDGGETSSGNEDRAEAGDEEMWG